MNQKQTDKQTNKQNSYCSIKKEKKIHRNPVEIFEEGTKLLELYLVVESVAQINASFLSTLQLPQCRSRTKLRYLLLVTSAGWLRGYRSNANSERSIKPGKTNTVFSTNSRIRDFRRARPPTRGCVHVYIYLPIYI